MSIRVRPGRVPRLLRRCEAGVGLTAAVLVVFGLLCAGILYQLGNGRVVDPHEGWKIGGWLAAMACEGVYICLLSDAIRDRQMDPFAPRFALRYGRVPLLLRPVAVLWWAAHFAAVTWCAYALEEAVGEDDALHHTFGSYGLAIQFGLFLFVGFTLAFASNLYAVLAVASAGGSERAVGTFWRYRLGLDLAVAVAAAVAADYARAHPYGWSF